MKSNLPLTLRESISREELDALPLRQFEGDIVVVETPGMVKSACEYLRKFPVVGFDTETKPSFKKGQNHSVALLQMATRERAFLVRLHKTGLPPEIRKLFTDSGILKPGAAIRDDLKSLQKITRFTPAGFVELQDQASSLGIKDFSLKKLCAILLGFRISKSQQLTNWEADLLTHQQMVYAATDAWASLEIYERLQEIFRDGGE